MSDENKPEVPDPVAEVVELLQDHLNDALMGQLRSIVIISVDSNGEPFSAYKFGEEDDIPCAYLGMDMCQDRIKRGIRAAIKAERDSL